MKEFVEDCRSLGATRFIVIGDGAILESVNDFGRAISYNPIPNKGTYATISTEDKSFECHINLHKVRNRLAMESRHRGVLGCGHICEVAGSRLFRRQAVQ